MRPIEINLAKVKCHWLTCSKAAERHPIMEAQLIQLGINGIKVDGDITNPYTFGVANSHLGVIRHDIYTKESSPLLIIEDDAKVTENYKQSFTVPEGTDALYLGTSVYGRNHGQTLWGGAVAKSIDNDYCRVFNMLSMHAILYLSEEYKSHILELLNQFDGEGGVDDKIAESMDRFNVLACKKPMFYQNDGHSERATLTPLQTLF